MTIKAESGVIARSLARWANEVKIITAATNDSEDELILKKIEVSIADVLLAEGIFDEVLPLKEEDFDEWHDYLGIDLVIGG